MSDTIGKLLEARAAEKAQALFYRALSVIAEERGLDDDVEALNGMLADEQHHLSRLSARLVELGAQPPALDVATPACNFSEWRTAARQRERAEIARYEQLIAGPVDAATAAVLHEILAVEREHEANLGGKYTEA